MQSIIKIFKFIASLVVCLILFISVGSNLGSFDESPNFMAIGANLLLWGGIFWLINRKGGKRKGQSKNGSG